MSSDKKRILVLGATGAQGRAVVTALLKGHSATTPSPYVLRALVRNAESEHAQELAKKGVELFQGDFEDFNSIATAMKGCYGVWVNVDTFVVGAIREVYITTRIFEIAKCIKSLRHWVLSGLDYSLKIGGWDLKYSVDHHNAKGRFGEYLKAQPSVVSDDEMSWSIVSTAPYMEMLQFPMFGPIRVRPDGTVVFASSIDDGHVPMVALDDIGFFARWTFDHRAETSAQDLHIASDIVGWDYLVETYTRVTGRPAVFVRQTIDEWWANFRPEGPSLSLARSDDGVPGVTTRKQNFTAWWAQWRDDLIQRDLDWVHSVHPNVMSLEKWMRATGYTGDRQDCVLNVKQMDRVGTFVIDQDAVSNL
ncbi:nmrA-family protein [Fistulina hepatica ATCC 64428]|uniref:NmrA-family protein n=1 Tax=Fistulina hepatica ATCC 64428 TaxID=1128425 RepID=A0A0D7A6T1_9AGAR|nr:nmrA-family protein [Fistulina hepatica ATCC 64428]